MTRQCLLIMPQSFYSMARTLQAALEEMGYAVTHANDEYPANALGKVFAKLDLPLSRWLTRRAFHRKGFLAQRWDLVLILKGRGIGSDLVADLRQTSARICGYHFDAIAYDPATRHWCAGVDRVSTFDYADAQKNNWPVVELFATLPAPESQKKKILRASAILRNHSNRLAYISEIFDIIGSDETFVYIYEKNILTFLLNVLNNPPLYWKWRGRISFQPMPYKAYIETLESSDFTIDYAHPKQTGVTIRCLEARSTGAKIITSNPYTIRSALFDPRSIVTHQPGAPADALRKAMDASAGYRPDPIARTPKAFLQDVLGIEPVRP